MKRFEFIEKCKTLSDEELHNIARESREMAENVSLRKQRTCFARLTMLPQ